MKRRYSTLIFLVLVVLCLSANPIYAQEPKVSAEAAVLLDADTGEILFGKNHNEQRPPASTTKILTAIMAIEQGDLQDVVEISQRAAQTGESRLNLVAGEKITLENLLYGALVKSGNDTCVAIAEHVSGSVEEFVDLMNLKAQLIGCYNSNFVNTNGLPAKNHYSSALDLALLARYALQNPTFAKIVATPYVTVEWEESNRKRDIKNTNRLLGIFSGANGVKTGTTTKAGQCLVASANRDGRNLIAVVLKSSNRFGDATTLLNYGLNNFRNVEIVQANKTSTLDYDNAQIKVKTGKKLIVTVEKNDLTNITHETIFEKSVLESNIIKGQVVGYSKYYNCGAEIGLVPLLAAEKTDAESKTKINLNKIWQLIKGKLYL